MTIDKPVARVKIIKTPHEREYQVMAYDADGKRMPNSDAFETDKVAAQQTANAMLAHGAMRVASEQLHF
jgi:hypothetical protein